MTKMKDKRMVQGFGIQLGQYCWERPHNRAHEISMKDFGCTWFMKAAIRKDSNVVILALFRDTLVVFH